ncbi:Protein of unknown function [Gryllus bimaculatus]|nr:Protein of unknown function [Gryllus bimaculatus]
MCTQSKFVRILFPRSIETEALEQKVLPTIFKMRKLDGMYKQNKVNDESDQRNKYISTAKGHPVGMVDSASFNNVSINVITYLITIFVYLFVM